MFTRKLSNFLAIFHHYMLHFHEIEPNSYFIVKVCFRNAPVMHVAFHGLVAREYFCLLIHVQFVGIPLNERSGNHYRSSRLAVTAWLVFCLSCRTAPISCSSIHEC